MVCWHRSQLVIYLQSRRDLQLVYFLVVLTKRLAVLLEMDSIYTNMINAIEYRKGNGLYLAPHPRFVEGGGLFLKHGEDISDGAGLLKQKNSPFWDGYFLSQSDIYSRTVL